MKIKKLLIPLLCLILVCMCVFTASAASTTFSDVGKGKWYTPHIEYAVENGIFNGTSATTFSPETNMTRAQFVQVFANMSGVDTSNKNVKTQFSDVPSGKWYTPAVKWAAENGVVNGMGDGKFAPEQPVTREQMCVMLVNYVEKFQKKSLDSTINAQTFKDDAKIASWAKTSVYKCVKAGLVNGVGENKFDPQGTTTRAQGATFFSNFHKYSNPYTKSLIFELSKDSKSYVVKGIESLDDLEIIIPATYKGKPVTSIGYEAFNEGRITSVTLGENIVTIGEWAFRGCNELKKIILPNSVTNIEEGAFAGCSNLKKVTMGNNVTSIGKMAFYQCKQLQSINLSTSLKTIGIGAFAENIKLSEISLPDSLIKIDEQAFVGCTALKSITTPKNLEYIEVFAFAECTGLEQINIGPSKLKICPKAFAFCNSLKELYIPGNVQYIDIQSFAYCENLKKVVILDGLESIGSAAFQGCNAIEYMELPFIGHTKDSDQFIGWIFGIATWYKDNPIYVPDSLKTIYFTGSEVPTNALYGCDITVKYPFDENTGLIFTLSGDESYYIVKGTSLSNPVEIFIPSTYKNKPVKEIAFEAFANCTTITKVIISEGIEKIGGYAFYDCYKLMEIIIPNSIRELGSYPFNYNTIENYYNSETKMSYLGNTMNPYVILVNVSQNLSGSVSICDGCKVINGKAFYNSKATSVYLPDSLISIAQDAFDGCNFIESISLPSGIQKIGTSAFRCNLLTQITYRGTINMWNYIEKGWNWSYGSGINAIICTDGKLNLYE